MTSEQRNNSFRLGQKSANFISGLLAGVISVTVCNPLDIARTRLNVLNAPAHRRAQPKYTHFSHAMHTIWKQQGWRGFYSGYRTNVIAIPLFHSLFFPLYEYTKKKTLEFGLTKEQSCLAATITAGGICNTITNPIWVVRTRLMAQFLHPKNNQYDSASPFVVMKEMYQKEGLQSLFKGVVASLFTLTNAVIYFQTYEKMKEILNADRKPTIINIFISSTFAKIMATLLTYPITAVRTVIYDSRGKQKTRFINISRYIIKQNGVRGFYAGIIPDLIRLIPSNAIIFIVYEKMKRFL